MTTASDARTRNYFSSVWSNRFIIAAIVEGAVITGLMLAFVASQTLTSGTNIIEFLSLSFEGPAKWIFLGYIFYMILIVAIAVAAVFYNPFVVLHEFYHHIRTKGGIHRGSEKNANMYAKSFIDAYNRIIKQITESHLESKRKKKETSNTQ